VTVFPSQDAEFKGINPQDLAMLAEYFHDSAVKQLTEGGYQVVDKPGPGVARIRAAITHPVPVKPTMNTISTFIPQAWLLSAVTGKATGSNLIVGEIGVKAEMLDAQSNERLRAAVAKQAGKKWPPFSGESFAGANSWGQIQQAMDYWARKLRKLVDTVHGKQAARGLFDMFSALVVRG
jgi:Protein of unknown function (DUF3313)